MISKLLGLKDEKIKRLMALLEHIDYDSKSKTLIIDQNINVKIKGDYMLESDKHVRINSNYSDIDPEIGFKYSVYINSNELEQQRILKKGKDLL